MSKHKSRQPRPPKQWAARVQDDDDPTPRGAGLSANGGLIVHPDEFKRLVRLGVIDQHGRRLPQSGGTT